MDVHTFQDVAVSTFVAGTEHNLDEAARMFQSLQAEHKIIKVAVGSALEGYTAVWSNPGGVCDRATMRNSVVARRNILGAWVR